MHSIRAWVSAALLALTVAPAAAQSAAAPTTILEQTFEGSEPGWSGMGPTAKVSLTHEAADVHSGTGALRFDYGINKGEMNLLLLVASQPMPTTLKSVRFWVKADRDARLSFVVQEREGGGRYAVPFHAPAGQWQKVEIALTDLIPLDGKDDPKDADGKLDPDQVAGCAIIDFTQIFAQTEDAGLARALNIQTGAHALYLDDFTVSTEALPTAAAAPGETVIDAYVRPQVGWTVLGQASPSLVTGKPLEGRSLKVAYHVGPAAILGLLHPVRVGALKGATRLTFTLASAKPTRLVVQLEETDGGKYNATVEVKGDSSPQTVDLALADFTAADDSKDANATLDKDLIKSMVVLDPAGLFGGAEMDNTLWIGPIKAQ